MSGAHVLLSEDLKRLFSIFAPGCAQPGTANLSQSCEHSRQAVPWVPVITSEGVEPDVLVTSE